MSTHVKIQTITCASAQASVDFTSIPATYTDLKLVISARSSKASGIGDELYISFNGSTSDFTGLYLQAVYGTTPTSGSLARYLGAFPCGSVTASVFGFGEVYIPNYTRAAYKSFSTEQADENVGDAYTNITGGLWSSTAAINQITLAFVNNFVQYSSATLYGIKNL